MLQLTSYYMNQGRNTHGDRKNSVGNTDLRLNDTFLWGVVDDLVGICDEQLDAQVDFAVTNGAAVYLRQKANARLFSMADFDTCIQGRAFSSGTIHAEHTSDGYFVGLPIFTANDRPLGVLFIESPDPISINTELVSVLERYGRVIGTVLRSAMRTDRNLAEADDSESTAVYAICAWTKQIRIGDKWIPVEQFLEEHLGLCMTHGISEGAMDNLKGELRDYESAVGW